MSYSFAIIFTMENTPEKALKKHCRDLLGHDDIFQEEFAQGMDQRDPLASFRQKFTFPTIKDIPQIDKSEFPDLDQKCIYLTGHSLGLKPKSADVYMQESLDAWGKLAQLSHFTGSLPASKCDLPGRKLTAKLIGADESDVVLMNGLTVNLNLLLLEFYQPQPDRHIILIEKHVFPSDLYAAKSQVELRGFDPATSIVKLEPRKGEFTLRTEDILRVIDELGERIALILLPGVQFLTGQKFDMEVITAAGHQKGCIVLWDLAHAIGNVKVDLNKWEADCACWCSYKYLNSGAGGLAGIYINKKHLRRKPNHLLGWWGNRESTRFEMREDIDLAEGVEGFRISNPPPWTASLNLASLKIFDETSMEELTAKQFLLTGYMEALLLHYCKKDAKYTVEIITPSDPKQRGNQLSLLINCDVREFSEKLLRKGIIVDERPPNIIRATPAPLYINFHDVYRFVQQLRSILYVD